MLDGWRDGGQIDLHAEMLALTQRITRVMLGDDFATDGRRFMETISVRRRYQEYLLGSRDSASQVVASPPLSSRVDAVEGRSS